MKDFIIICSVAIIMIACTASKPIIPGDAQLSAIKQKYPDISMDKLNAGYRIFIGECTKCHRPKNLYKRKEEDLPGIIDKMSKRAKITDEQKDAVLKYALSVKAAQPVDSK